MRAAAACLLAALHWGLAAGFPSRGESSDVVLLGAGVGVTPPSPDLSQQAEALEKSASSAQVASSQDAAAGGDADNADAAKAVGQQTMVAKSADAGADPSVVASQAAAEAEPDQAATTGPDQDNAAEMSRSQSISRAQEVDEEAVNSQREEEKQALTKSAGSVVPGVAAAAAEQMDPDAVAVPNDDQISHSSEHDSKGLPGYFKLAKMTVPKEGILTRLQGSLTHCQDACNRATLCTGIEFSKENGGVCILLRHGLRWSRTFEYYEKDSPDAIDPQRISKFDKQLMWGDISERSHDLGGLAMNDVPGATLYKPPTKDEIKRQKTEQKARYAIRNIAQSLKDEAVKSKQDVELAKQAQSHAVMLADHTRDIAKQVQAKEENVEHHDVRAQLHAAQLQLMTTKMIAKAGKRDADLKRLQSQAIQYEKAAEAFKAAGNPLAEWMHKKAKEWRVKAARVKESGVRAKQQAELAKLHSEMAADDVTHWSKEAQWANKDESRAQTQLQNAVELQHNANAMLDEKKKHAKEAFWKAHCHPICDYDFDNPTIYHPRKLKNNQATGVQYEYTRKSEWEYPGKVVRPIKADDRPLVVTNNPPSVLVDSGMSDITTAVPGASRENPGTA